MNDFIQMWADYQKALNKLKYYNRADTVNMSENEMNSFRHLAGPAILTQSHKPRNIKMLGYSKELKDLLQGRGLEDAIHDLKNNSIGISLGKKYHEVNEKSLMDYVYKNYIEKLRYK